MDKPVFKLGMSATYGDGNTKYDIDLLEDSVKLRRFIESVLNYDYDGWKGNITVRGAELAKVEYNGDSITNDKGLVKQFIHDYGDSHVASASAYGGYGGLDFTIEISKKIARQYRGDVLTKTERFENIFKQNLKRFCDPTGNNFRIIEMIDQKRTIGQIFGSDVAKSVIMSMDQASDSQVYSHHYIELQVVDIGNLRSASFVSEGYMPGPLDPVRIKTIKLPVKRAGDRWYPLIDMPIDNFVSTVNDHRVMVTRERVYFPKELYARAGVQSDYDYPDYREAFMEGAKWALENLINK